MLAFFGTHPVPLSIIRGLAPRLAETKSFEPNPHVENTTFTFYRFDFDGLVVTGMTFAPELLTLSSVTVTTPAWPIGHGLHVGVSEQAVIDALGPPTDKEVGMLHYDGVSDSMTFRIRAQRVTQVEFDFYVD